MCPSENHNGSIYDVHKIESGYFIYIDHFQPLVWVSSVTE